MPKQRKVNYETFISELKASEVMDWQPDDWRWEDLADHLEYFFESVASPNDSIAELSIKFFEANKDNDMNLSKSKAYCLSNIEKAFAKAL